MSTQKIKISGLGPINTENGLDGLIGLQTIGVDADNKSVRVPLEFIKTAVDSANTATQEAINAVDSLRRGVDGGEAHTRYGGCFVFDGGNADTI